MNYLFGSSSRVTVTKAAPAAASAPAPPKLPGSVKPVRGATYPPAGAPSSSAAPGGTSSPASASPGPTRAGSAAAIAAAPAARTPPPAASAAAAPSAAEPSPQPAVGSTRARKIERLLAADVVDLPLLRAASSWTGIPAEHRAESWKLLLGYLPPNKEWREATLQRKRREYADAVPQYFEIDDSQRSEYQKGILHQILIDVPRTSSTTMPAIFHHEVRAARHAQPPPLRPPSHPTRPPPQVVQRALERVLYIWALRHPASGYVQGINDLATPFFLVFLTPHLPRDRPAKPEDVAAVAPATLAEVEADTFWCLSKLIDSIQDHYTFAQPGIQRMVFKLKELTARIDAKLHAHLMEQNLHFIQFAFRWMNCLLMRELSIDLILRLWDTYLAEHNGGDDDGANLSEGFAVMHVYACAALLARFSPELQQMEFQDLVVYLQHLPTSGWTDKDVGELLSQAYVFKSLYHNAPGHLSSS